MIHSNEGLPPTLSGATYFCFQVKTQRPSRTFVASFRFNLRNVFSSIHFNSSVSLAASTWSLYWATSSFVRLRASRSITTSTLESVTRKTNKSPSWASSGHSTNQNANGKSHANSAKSFGSLNAKSISSRQPGLLSEMKWSCMQMWSDKYTLSTAGSISSRSMANKSSISISSSSSCVHSGTGMSVPSGTVDGSWCEGPGIHGETCGRGLVLSEESLLPRFSPPAPGEVPGRPTSGGINISTSGMDGPPRWGTEGMWFRISSIVSNPTKRNWTKQIWDMFSWRVESSTRLQGDNSK